MGALLSSFIFIFVTNSFLEEKELLLFSVEVDQYLENPSDDSAKRIATIYFNKMNKSDGAETNLRTYLAQTIKQNSNSTSQMIQLGGIFVGYAKEIVKDDRKRRRRRVLFALATGSYAMIGAEIELIIQRIKGPRLPPERSIKIAEDFYNRYPRGEDFISALAQ